MNKKGWTHFSRRSLYSFFFGIIASAVGILPFLKMYGQLPIPFWDTPLPAEILLVFGSTLILMDSFRRRTEPSNKISILIGILIALVGLLPLLLRFNLLKSLPFVIELIIPPLYIYALLAFFGVYLLFEAVVMRD